MATARRRFYHKRNRLKQFRVFCQVARSGGITRAAERLGLGQPSVSQQVRSLEKELGVRLFERNGPRIALTVAGESLYRTALPLVEGMDSLHDAFAEQNDRIAGVIRIAAGQASKSFILPRLLKQFHDHYPDVRFRIARSATSEALRLLRARMADLAFSGADETPAGIDRHRVLSYGLVLVVPLGHPLAGRESVDMKEASLYPAVVPASGTYSRMFGELEARQLGIEINVAVEAHGWGALKRYVEAGLGISVIPDFCVTDQDRVSVIPLPLHLRARDYWMYARRDGPGRSPAIERFIRFVAPLPRAAHEGTPEHAGGLHPHPRGEGRSDFPRNIGERRPEGR